jgi:NAD(P)-dependent dehydrogenase (short-subunit alcohol dehydrogenase family)
VAIVAGAGGALGHATTATLAASGLTAVAVDRNERGLRELPDSARTEVADTIDPAVATRLIDRIAGEVGPPDVLVNTIGALRPGDALTTTPEKLRLTQRDRSSSRLPDHGTHSADYALSCTKLILRTATGRSSSSEVRAVRSVDVNSSQAHRRRLAWARCRDDRDTDGG